ncbi:hypothetical protein ABER98_11535 [Domibacillus aminovorans]|uniref:hypothetical protein n=1 Tax=Domibacillus aminovorans TaxID=29332 RepID=UPI003D1D2E83
MIYIKVRYYYNRIDINGDGVPGVIVYLVGPFVCGTGGCSLVIFKQLNQSYQLISSFTLVNNPIIVSRNKTNGYNDLIMFVSGGGIEPYYAEIKYGANGYPSNPSVQPKVKPGTKVTGIAVISDDISTSPGIQF